MDWSDVGDLPVPAGVDAEAFKNGVDVARDYCGWHIAPQYEQTLTFDGPGTRKLRLPTLAVDLISNVLEDGNPLEVNTDYVLGEGCVLVRRCRPWTCSTAGITLTLSHGWEKAPRTLLVVAKSLAMMDEVGALSQVTAGPFNISTPKGSEAGAAGLSEYHEAALASLRLGPRP